MSDRVRNGWFVTEDAVYAVINGSLYEVDPVGPIADLPPGSYDDRLRPATVVVKWDESEHPREPAGSPDGGQFTESGGGGGGGADVGVQASGIDAAEALKAEWAKSSPLTTIDKLMAVGKEDQKKLVAVASAIEGKVSGVKFIQPPGSNYGLKSRERTQDKIDGGRTPQSITDVVRGGFKVDTPAQAEEVVRTLAKEFAVADEGWEATDAGYFDRKLMLKFSSGTVAEIQMWHPMLYGAKFPKGTDLYTRWRDLPKGSPERKQLKDAMRELYDVVLAKLPPTWDPIIKQMTDRARARARAS